MFTLIKKAKVRYLKSRGRDLRFVIEQEEQRKLLADQIIQQAREEISRIQLKLIQLEFPIYGNKRRPMATRLPKASGFALLDRHGNVVSP